MITSASPEWVPLRDAYYHLYARSPSPEAAKITIETARKNGQLRIRCTLREYLAQSGLHLPKGEEPPRVPPVVTPDYSIPAETMFKLDSERSYATRHDSETRSHFEYLEIVVHRDAVLALSSGPPRFVLPEIKPHPGITDMVWVVMRVLVTLRNETDPAVYNLLSQEQLVVAVNGRLEALTGTFGQPKKIEMRTLQTAVAELKRQFTDWSQ
jgi:hypothetical protein